MENQTASNIAAAVEAKTNPGTPVDKKTEKSVDAASTESVDPNAGKEKYIVDGKEHYLTAAEARAYVQKGIAFEPKVSQLGRLQQETDQFLKVLKDDPAKILFNPEFGKPEDVLGKIMSSTKVSDATKTLIGQWYYDNVVAPEQMSPEQRELRELKQREAEWQRVQKEQENDRLNKENEAKVQMALETIKGQIREAMGEAGVPLDSKIAPQIAKRVAQVMQLGYVNGKVVTPKEAISKVKMEILEYQKAYYDSLDEDRLVEQIGKENAEKIRKYFIKALKEKDKDKKKDFKPSQKRDERKTMTPDQFKDYLADLKSKGK